MFNKYVKVNNMLKSMCSAILLKYMYIIIQYLIIDLD